MNILFLGDPHLKINNFEQSLAFLKWVDEVVEKYKPDVVCNLGDTFETHTILRSEILTEFKYHVERVTKQCPYWYVLGNHDFYKPKDGKYHALQTFNIPNFTIFDKATELEGITIVPFIPDFSQFPMQTQPILIAHQTFIGADYGFKREECGVNADLLSAEIIISGHVHKRQSYGKVVYPGTPFCHSASDIDQSKGLMLFNTTTYEQTFIEAPFTKWRGIEFEMSDTNTLPKLHELLKVELNDKDKWVIKVSGPKIEMAAYFKSEPFLSLIKGKNVVTKAVPNDKNKQKVQIKATSMEAIMAEYVDKVYDGNIDRSLILQRINEIITKIR